MNAINVTILLFSVSQHVAGGFQFGRIRPTPDSNSRTVGLESMTTEPHGIRSGNPLQSRNRIKRKQMRELQIPLSSPMGNERQGTAKSIHRTLEVDVARVDPWGLEDQRSHLDLPAWACENEAEFRHLAAMKIVLEQDLRKLKEKTLVIGGRRIKAVEAFPDVYGDMRLLRFLRKDKVQDPVTAALRYRQFLQWREESNVDDIRLRIEERIRHGDVEVFEHDKDGFGEYIPCPIKALRSQNGLVPVCIHPGKWNIKGLSNRLQNGKSSIRSFLAYWVYLLEALNLYLYKESLRTGQLVFVDVICDFKDMSMAQFSPTFMTTVLPPWVQMAQSYFPETLHQVSFIRPGKVCSLLIRMISPIFSRGTVSKFSIYPDDESFGCDFCSKHEESGTDSFERTTFAGLGIAYN